MGEGPSLTPQSPLWAVSATSLKEGYQACTLGRIDPMEELMNNAI